MSVSIVAVTLVIKTGLHMAQGMERKVLYFNEFPTTGDIKDNLEDGDKFSELVNCCEVADISHYTADYESEDNFISFECHDNDGHIGSIVVEAHPLHNSSLVVV